MVGVAQAAPGRRLQIQRHTYEAGDKLFVDYAGQTAPNGDASTGKIVQAQVFVAVLGAYDYTCACATPGQKAVDRVASIIAALKFTGSEPLLLVPHQPRALMARPDRYEPTSHRLAPRAHAALQPARVACTPGQASRQAQGGGGRPGWSSARFWRGCVTSAFSACNTKFLVAIKTASGSGLNCFFSLSVWPVNCRK